MPSTWGIDELYIQSDGLQPENLAIYEPNKVSLANLFKSKVLLLYLGKYFNGTSVPIVAKQVRAIRINTGGLA